MNFELCLKNADIVDGTGEASYKGHILVKDGKIDDILPIGSIIPDNVEKIIDADGYYVTPGFIDIHRHADAEAFRDNYGRLEMKQGLTTIVNGNCGLSIAPISCEHRKEIFEYLSPITGTINDTVLTGSMAEYLAALPKDSVNTFMLVGAGILRADVAGYKTVKLSDSHILKIQKAIEKALSEGALGVSLGLGYAPECFYTTAELIKVLAPLNGTQVPVTVHMREEGSNVLASIQEMMTVAEVLNCPVHISHLKAMGKENWGVKIPEALQLLHKYRDKGYNVSADVYPYTAGSTQLMHILPPDYLEGGITETVKRLKDRSFRHELDDRINERSSGCSHFDNIAKLAGWDGIFLSSISGEKNKLYQGKSIAEIAGLRGSSCLDACCDLLVEENCQITMIDFMASEDDIIRILKDPLSNVISDSTYPLDGKRHPRVCGTFTRILEHFVKELGVLSLEEAVMKMTSVPAGVLNLSGKGLIKKGYDADFCVFKLGEIHERATYSEPNLESEGMKHVVINGKVKF